MFRKTLRTKFGAASRARFHNAFRTSLSNTLAAWIIDSSGWFDRDGNLEADQKAHDRRNCSNRFRTFYVWPRILLDRIYLALRVCPKHLSSPAFRHAGLRSL